MKYMLSSIKEKMIKRYTFNDETINSVKSTNINVLLNRVRLDKKKESRKKLIFTAVTSLGVLLFGVVVF